VGVREDGRYVDPEALFGREVLVVRLVPESPIGGGGWRSPGQEAAELRLVAMDLGRRSGVEVLGGWVARLGGWGGALASRGSTLLGAALDSARHGGNLLWDAASGAPPAALGVLWQVAPYALGAFDPVLAGAIFNVVVPLLSGEIPPVVLFLTDILAVSDRIVLRTFEWWEHRTDCTPGDVAPAPPAERRIAVLVGGLDSTSDHAAVGGVRTDELGYAATDVLGFSYAGGRTPGPFDGTTTEVATDLADIQVTDYGQEHSSSDLTARGELLADLLTELHESSPGTPIDLYAHSQGGLVAHLAVVELERRPGGRAVIESLGLVATMATAHQGSDLATMSVAASGSLDLSVLIRTAGSLTGMTLHPRDTNIGDLARRSDLIHELGEAGLPNGPSYLTIGSRGDPIVTEARTRLTGATHSVVPGFGLGVHGDLIHQPATTRELALGLGGLPPTCQSLWSFMGDVAVIELTQLGSSLLGLELSLRAMPIVPIDALEFAVRW
jgi:hypothetical protein